MIRGGTPSPPISASTYRDMKVIVTTPHTILLMVIPNATPTLYFRGIISEL
jgi:hypothetical protein